LGYLTPPPAPAPVIVQKDVGGLVTDYEAQTEVYRRERREVRLRECRSACTMALSLPNVCVYPDSVLKFHQAYNAINRQTDYGVSAQLLASYPQAVRERLGNLTRQYKILSGAELIELGVRNCNDDNRVMVASAKPIAPQSRTDASPLSDIARTVQSAVAQALGRPEGAPQAPIRVAATRLVSPNMANLIGRDVTAVPAGLSQDGYGLPPRLPGETKIEAAYGEIPLPPRRPPSLAFSLQELTARPYLQLIQGAQPIMEDKQFTPFASARSD
jgi:hypothetical protein